MFIDCAAQTPPERWVLVYSGGSHRRPYAVSDLLRLLSVVDTAGTPIAPLCSSVILTEFRAASGRYYMPWTDGTPSTQDDWNEYLDSLFALDGLVSRLDSAAAVARRVSSRKIAVAVMVPYPDRSQAGGPASDSQRMEQVHKYLRVVLTRMSKLPLKHLDFSAFYWLNEAVRDDDTAMVSRIASIVHDTGKRFLWIPYWCAQNSSRWRSLGFDQAWPEPHYSFHPQIAINRVDSAVERATTNGMGLELEFDGRLFSNPQFFDRLGPYLVALEAKPELRNRSIAIYEGAGALIQLSRSRDAQHRALYNLLVAALQPDFQP